MEKIEKYVKLINKVREAEGNYEVAYVARSRINRLIISLKKLIGKEIGVKYTIKPEPINYPSDIPVPLKNLASIYNRILSSSSTLCQPSEPLNDRWKRGWTELLFELDELEKRLNSVDIK